VSNGVGLLEWCTIGAVDGPHDHPRFFSRHSSDYFLSPTHHHSPTTLPTTTHNQKQHTEENLPTASPKNLNKHKSSTKKDTSPKNVNKHKSSTKKDTSNKHKSSNKKDAPLSNKKEQSTAVTVTAITNKIQECKIISQTPPSAAAAAEDEDEYADSDVDMPDVVTLDDAEPSGRKLRDINYDVVTLDETKVAASYDPKLLLQAIKVSDISACSPPL
jgi:hypothetical protein